MIMNAPEIQEVVVFTLQSIKSRIETNDNRQEFWELTGFLLYSPLNQGLKRHEQDHANNGC